jgi:hypothetical protein
MAANTKRAKIYWEILRNLLMCSTGNHYISFLQTFIDPFTVLSTALLGNSTVTSLHTEDLTTHPRHVTSKSCVMSLLTTAKVVNFLIFTSM